LFGTFIYLAQEIQHNYDDVKKILSIINDKQRILNQILENKTSCIFINGKRVFDGIREQYIMNEYNILFQFLKNEMNYTQIKKEKVDLLMTVFKH